MTTENNEQLIKDLSHVYAKCAEVFEGFQQRPSQKRMAYEIGKGLYRNESVTIAEAGTGVGKSLAYLMSAVTAAVRQDKKLIISTGTIALQEQLMDKDIPFFHDNLSPIEFTYKLAKGRSNYVCHINMLNALGKGGDMIGGLPFAPSESDIELLNEMLDQFESGEWDGDRSSFGNKIPNKLWEVVKSSPHSCKKFSSEHKNCAFHKARADLNDVNVIIANHALVLKDLSMGGGIILTDPDDTIYVFDEGHHIDKVARSTSALELSARSIVDFNESCRKTIFRHQKKVKNEPMLEQSMNKIQDVILPALNEADQLTSRLTQYFDMNEKLFDEGNYLIREPNSEETALFSELLSVSKNAIKPLKEALESIDEMFKQKVLQRNKDTEQVYTDFLFYLEKFDYRVRTFDALTSASKEGSDLVAKWVSKGNNGYTLNTCPVSSHNTLKSWLWDVAKHVVVASATISSLGTLEHFKREVGAPPQTLAFSLPSPFDFQANATLYLPTVKVSPQNQKEFTAYLCEAMLSNFIVGQTASLVLFSSYWQMEEVAKEVMIPLKKLGIEVLVQGDLPKATILERHAQNVKNGTPSVLFGTGSFSEGLDLPRELLKNVIITKIPFPMPKEPVSVIHGEAIEKAGGNSFAQLSLPESSKHLIQSVGRLIRTEEDTGRILILDNRMTTKGYGKRLLGGLPPFRVVYGSPE